MNEWQPIETAPKDGQRIEALVSGKPEIVFWGKVSHLNWYGWNSYLNHHETDLCRPTEWRPLPEDPEPLQFIDFMSEVATHLADSNPVRPASS